MIAHTPVQQVTSTQEDLSKIITPVAEKAKDVCRNEAGSTGDFNTYDTKEQAEAALKRWLERYNKTGTMIIKVVDP
jgi:hypothetical protein